MNGLVIGFGSIGQRHYRVLTSLGVHTSVVSRHLGSGSIPAFPTINDALATTSPDSVIIANQTHEHFDSLVTLRTLGYLGPILIEKPLFDSVREIPVSFLRNVFVAYNLRFHPSLQRLKTLLTQDTAISAHIYVGQYLPNWRQGDYRNCYSASRQAGGGVLRDLSHELDYAQWLFGPCQYVAGLGGHFSNLEIDSDDIFGALMATNTTPLISIQMNYLDRLGRRQLLVNTNEHTYLADLVANTLQVDKEVNTFRITPDDTYRLQLQAMIDGRYSELCSAEKALETVELIERIEQSAQNRKWASR